VKVVLNIMCFGLFVNTFTFLIEIKKLGQKALPNEPNVYLLLFSHLFTFCMTCG
jgi:hypothetical protein